MCPSPALTARHFWRCAIYWTRIAAISGMLMMSSHPTLIVRIKLSLVAMTLISSPTVCHLEQDSAPLPRSAVLFPFWCIWFPRPTRIHPMTSKQNQYQSFSSLSIHRSSFLPQTLFWRTLCLLTSIAGHMSVNASSMALPQVWTILFVWWVWNESHALYWSPGHSLHFRKGQFEVKSCPSISLLIINTNVPKNTKEMVSKVRQLYTSFPSIIQPLFDSINEQIRYVLEVEQEVFYYSMYEWA